VVQGQQGLSSASGEPFLRFAYDPPAVFRTETFEVDADGAPSDDPSPRDGGGNLQAPTRGAWFRVAGASLGSEPAVDLVSEDDGSVLPCRPDPAVRPAGSDADHDITWCLVVGASGHTFRLRLRAAMAGSATLGMEAPLSYTIAFRPATITAVFFDSLAATGAAPDRRRDVSISGEGRTPTSGGFLVHVVGDSFSDDARVLVGGRPCDVVAGRVDPAAPLGLGAVTTVGEGARGGAFQRIGVDATALLVGSRPAPLRPPVDGLDPAGSARVWLTHELVFCRVPAGTGSVGVVVTPAGRNASAALVMAYHARRP